MFLLAKRLVAALVWALSMTLSVAAHMVEDGAVQVIHPWVEPSDGENSRAFPTIANDGTEPLILTGAESAAAEAIAIVVDGREVARLEIPAEDVVPFEVGEAYLRLDGLSAPLEEGGAIAMTLKFEGRAPIEVTAVIGEDTAAPNTLAEATPSLNLTHDPIPAIGWPTMTMDLAVLPSAGEVDVSPGDPVIFELDRGPDGIYAISAIWRADDAPPAADDTIRATGVINETN